MHILRLENAQGDGPFGSQTFPLMAMAEMQTPEGWRWPDVPPAPQDDGIWNFNSYDPDEVCGCVNARQLVQWFPHKVRKALEPYGFRTVTYECPEGTFEIGGHQAVFDRREARLVQ